MGTTGGEYGDHRWSRTGITGGEHSKDDRSLLQVSPVVTKTETTGGEYGDHRYRYTVPARGEYGDHRGGEYGVSKSSTVTVVFNGIVELPSSNASDWHHFRPQRVQALSWFSGSGISWGGGGGAGD